MVSDVPTVGKLPLEMAMGGFRPRHLKKKAHPRRRSPARARQHKQKSRARQTSGPRLVFRFTVRSYTHDNYDSVTVEIRLVSVLNIVLASFHEQPTPSCHSLRPSPPRLPIFGPKEQGLRARLRLRQMAAVLSDVCLCGYLHKGRQHRISTEREPMGCRGAAGGISASARHWGHVSAPVARSKAHPRH